MKTEKVSIGDIHPAEYNPRKELQPGEQEYEALKNSIDRFGQTVPLIVNEKTGTLISGHQRLNVMKETGVEEAEVVLVDLDEDREKLLNMALNKIDGEWDYEKLEEILKEIPADDIKFTGFSNEELDSLYEAFPAPEEELQEGQQKEENEDPADDEKAESPDNGKDKEFLIYLSFPDKEEAEKWLNDRDIQEVFTGRKTNVVIDMEGSGYGKNN